MLRQTVPTWLHLRVTSKLLTAAGDGSAETPLHGVLRWEKGRGGNLSSFVLEEQRVQSPHWAYPGFPRLTLPPSPEPPATPDVRAAREERSGPTGQHRGALPGKSGPGAPTPAGSRRDPPAAQPHRPPDHRSSCQGHATFSHPSSKGAPTLPPRLHTAAAPDRDRGSWGEQGRRPALTAAAASCGPQHPSSSTRQPAARLQLRRRSSIPPAQELRGRPWGAGIARRGSAAPAGGSHRPPRRQRPPLCRTRPLLRAQVLPGLQYSSAPGAGGVGHAATAPPRGGHNLPPPFPRAPRFCRLEERAPPLPALHLHRAGSWTPDYFLQRKLQGWVGEGAVVASAGSPLWRGGRQARGSPGSVSAHPAPLRCDASAGTAQTSCLGTLWVPAGAAPLREASSDRAERALPALGAPGAPPCGEGAREAAAPCPARPEWRRALLFLRRVPGCAVPVPAGCPGHGARRVSASRGCPLPGSSPARRDCVPLPPAGRCCCCCSGWARSWRVR